MSNIFNYIDWILFIPVFLTIIYLAFFAVASLIVRHSETPTTKHENRFIIMIPAYKAGKSLEMTVRSILGQSYPQRLFDVTVIADHESEMTLFHLAQQPITLLTPNFEKSSRTKSLQLAINNLPQFKIYDTVLILEAGDVVEPEFLEQVNDAYESAGTKAIQTHKLSLNRDTTSARLSAIFEEINNSIFRRGHITVGLSSALSSSGMVFDFNWFRQHILETKSTWEDRVIEAQLLRERVYVDYFDKILLYGEKARQAEDFNRQHRRYLLTQIRTVFRNIRHMPIALFNRQYDLLDKLIQWLLIPRMLLMAIIGFMSVVTPMISFGAVFKWWGLFAGILLVFALATPDYLVDDKWNSTFFKLPIVLCSSLLGKFKFGRKIKEYINLKR